MLSVNILTFVLKHIKIVNKFFHCIWKGEREREIKTENLNPLVDPSNTTSGAQPGQPRGPRTQSGSPRQMAES